MTTPTTTMCSPSVKHTTRNDPYLRRIVHEYRPVCTCLWRGRVTGAEPAAWVEAVRHGRGL